MNRVLVIIALCLAGCTPLKVSYGDVEVLPIVHPSSDRSRWYFSASTEQFGEHLFFFDTGYSVTTCDDDFANTLGLKARGDVKVRGEAGTIQATHSVLPPLTVGGHVVEGLPCLIRDLQTTSSIRDPREVPIAGVIGADLLSRFFVVVDPVEMTITLSDPETAPRLHRDGAGVVRLMREGLGGTRRLMPMTIDGIAIQPIIDTGASHTHIDGQRLGMLPYRVRKGATIRGSGGDPTMVRDVPLYRGDITLSEYALSGVELTGRTSSGSDQGLLGLNVLSQFRQEYDWKRGWVRLTPVTPGKVPRWEPSAVVE